MEPQVKLLPPEICTNYKLGPNEKLLSISVPNSKIQGPGIVGILTVPPTALKDEKELELNPTSSENHYPPTHKLAILLHGKGGHKNYCYQAICAQELASKLGFYSFRFDFRGCGDSQGNESLNEGRRVSQDVVDIEIVYDIFKHGFKTPEIGIDLMPYVIIGHSRGGVAMFQWANEQQKKQDHNQSSQYVPHLVNCASRYQSSLLLKFGNHNGKDVMLNQYRYGKYQDIRIAPQEVEDLARQDLSVIKYLDEDIQVLSLYGLNDHIVPIEDSTFFANLLGSRHQLTFVPHADHNYYGTTVITDENEIIHNPDKLPLTRRGMVNWNYRVTREIINWLHTFKDVSRFRESTKQIYSFPRWRNIEGIANFRDIGGWRTSNNKYYVKAGLVYRCANTSNVTEYGKDQLRELGVKAMFDFRSVGEFEKAGGLVIDGIDVQNTPVFRSLDMSPQAIALRYRNLLLSWYTYKLVYENMLEHGPDAFKLVLIFLRDNPNTAISYNCTAGKDRTGVMTMLILLILGVDSHVIAKEYELTTIGLRPNHAQLLKEFKHMKEGFQKRLHAEKGKANKLFEHMEMNLTDEEMFENLVSSKYESMISTIHMFNRNYGGIEGYCRDKLGLADEDLEKIRKNLLTDARPFPDSGSVWKHRTQFSLL
jgi:pimeloyl-ACP methyl ester carboxylesterase